MLGRVNPRVRHRKPPTFAAFDYAPSVGRLPAELAPNGVSQAPMLRYTGKDATASAWPAWGYGPALALAGSGTAPTPDQSSPLMGDRDGAVLFNSGKGYGSAETSQGDLGIEDLVVEVVFRYGPALNGVIIGKRAAGPGWVLYRAGSEYLGLRVRDVDGDDKILHHSGVSLVAGCWYHMIGFVNRDEASTNGSRFFINGVSVGSGEDCSAAAQTATNAASLSAGSFSGTTPSDACLAYAAAWKRADWIRAGADGLADMATLAARRFALLTGTAARIAKGSNLPTVATRTSAGMLDRVVSGVRRFYRVGDNWIRTCDRTDLDGKAIRGVLVELQRTQKLLQSASPSNVAWTAGNLGTWESAAGVFDGYTCDGLVADANDLEHYVEQDRTLTAATYCLSAIVKAGASRWCFLADEDVANARCYFDLQDSGAVGTPGAGVTEAFMEELGGGWFRVWITFTATADPHTLRVGAAAADGDADFEGAGAADTWIQHVQCEAGEYPSAPIVSAAGEVTRIKDALRYNAAGHVNGATGRIELEMLVPQGNHAAGQYLFDASVAGGTNGLLRCYLDATGERPVFAGYEATVQRWASYLGLPDLCDGRRHKVSCDWRSGRQAPEADGVPATPATFAGTMPAGIDRLEVGNSETAAGQLGGLISRLRIMAKARR